MIHPTPKEPPMTRPLPNSEDQLLEEGLEESFPASDPPSSARPHTPVWEQARETD
jgi:hypothetical protein